MRKDLAITRQYPGGLDVQRKHYALRLQLCDLR